MAYYVGEYLGETVSKLMSVINIDVTFGFQGPE